MFRGRCTPQAVHRTLRRSIFRYPCCKWIGHDCHASCGVQLPPVTNQDDIQTTPRPGISVQQCLACILCIPINIWSSGVLKSFILSVSNQFCASCLYLVNEDIPQNTHLGQFLIPVFVRLGAVDNGPSAILKGQPKIAV